MSRVAVLGLGAMGLPMATHLAGSHEVAAFDISADRLALAEAGAPYVDVARIAPARGGGDPVRPENRRG